jgi:hypothetical protein
MLGSESRSNVTHWLQYASPHLRRAVFSSLSLRRSGCKHRSASNIRGERHETNYRRFEPVGEIVRHRTG